MSLVSNEGDSEQNEIRNLQEKLESTMSLVKQLSSQLAELKEQVCALRRWSWVVVGAGGGWVWKGLVTPAEKLDCSLSAARC